MWYSASLLCKDKALNQPPEVINIKLSSSKEYRMSTPCLPPTTDILHQHAIDIPFKSNVSTTNEVRIPVTATYINDFLTRPIKSEILLCGWIGIDRFLFNLVIHRVSSEPNQMDHGLIQAQLANFQTHDYNLVIFRII